MGQAIGDLLPSAIGVALSPVPIIAVILILGTPRARSNGPAFALGWVIGLVIVSVVVVLLASGSDDADSGASTTVNVIKLVVGALFLVMALAQWRKRPRSGTEATMPKWMQAIDQFTGGKSLGFGAVLSGAIRRTWRSPAPPRQRSPKLGSTAATRPLPLPSSS